jgi:hypothetical protein
VPKFLEDKLKKQAKKEGLTGRDAASYIYGTMNKVGAMHGNKETAKGARMEAKHDRKISAQSAARIRRKAEKILAR